MVVYVELFDKKIESYVKLKLKFSSIIFGWFDAFMMYYFLKFV